MAAGVFDLAIEQGATFRRTVIWRDPNVNPSTPGPVKNLVGCTAVMEIRNAVADRADSVILLSLTTENGGIVITGAEGRLDIHATGVQTRTLTAKKAVYDLYVLYPGDLDDPIKILKGAVAIDKTVTDVD